MENIEKIDFLISPVGFNPVSCLYSAKLLRPSRVLLVHTAETLLQKEALVKQIKALGINVDTLELSLRAAVEQLIFEIDEKLKEKGSSGESTCLDITGGTKSMMLALYSTLKLYRPQFQMTHIGQNDGKLHMTWTGDIMESDIAIAPEEFLSWKGYRASKSLWRGKLSQIPEDMHKRHRLWQYYFCNWGEIREIIKTKKAIDPNPQNALPVPKLNIQPLPAGFRKEDGLLFEPKKKRFFSQGIWLEEFCLLEAQKFVGNSGKEIEAAHGMTLRRQGADDNSKEFGHATSNDEADVVLCQGTRIVVVEAKARLKSKESGVELQKRIAKTRTFFGDNARMIFVHPSYSEEALEMNQENIDSRLVRLVGPSTKDYHAALKWAFS